MHPSLAKAHDLLRQADQRENLADYTARAGGGYEAANQYRAEAAGLRAAANVHAITAQLEAAAPEPTPAPRACAYCGVAINPLHTYHRSDCPHWRP